MYDERIASEKPEPDMCSLYLLLIISMMSLLLRPSAAILALMVLYKAVPPFFVLFCWSFAGDFALFIFPKFIFSNYRKKIQRSRCGGFAVIIIRQNFNGFNRFRQNFYVSFDCTKEGVVFYAHCRRTKCCIKSEAILRQKTDKKGISCFSLARIADYLDVSLTTLSGERASRKLIGEMGKQELNLR